MPEMLTVGAVCQFLKLSDRTVYEMCRRGQLVGAAKVGGQWRIDKTKLLAWLEKGAEFQQHECKEEGDK